MGIVNREAKILKLKEPGHGAGSAFSFLIVLSGNCACVAPPFVRSFCTAELKFRTCSSTLTNVNQTALTKLPVLLKVEEQTNSGCRFACHDVGR